MTDLHLAELRVWDPAIAGLRTLRYGTAGYTTSPTATPANAWFDARIKQAASLRRTCFAPGTTQGRSTTGIGDLVLLNGDGELDALCGYGFDGRELIQWHTTADAPVFPDDFSESVATMDGVEVSRDAVTVRVRDRQFETAVPLQPNKYAGDNVLPDGLEGTADDLLGKPKPVCLGSVTNVPAVCVNTSKLIYQVHDGVVASIPNVYDRGKALWGDGPWASVALPDATFTCRGMARGGGYVVVVGKITAGPAPTIFYSDDDGATWSAGSHSFTGTLWAVLHDGTQFVAFSGGQEVQTSPTGATWTAQATSGLNVFAACYDPTDGQYVVGGFLGVLSTSPDLATWTPRTSSFGTTSILGITSDGVGHYVAVAGSSKAATSTGGAAWTQVTIGWTTTATAAITYANGLWLATTYARYVYTSTDGEGWKAVDLGVTRYVGGGCYDSGHYVLVSANGYVLTSDDGDTWQWRAVSGAWTNVVSTGTMFCAAGAQFVARSTVGGSGYADATDLEDDTLAPSGGAYRPYLAGGYFRLGATPAGLVTADVTAGDAAADRTAAQIFGRLLSPPLGTPLEFSAADVAALDAASNDVLDFWQGTEETTVAEACDQVAASAGAWWGVDRSGVFRIQQFTAPAAPALATFVMSDIKSLERLAQSDPGRGVPAWMTRVRYARNHAVQTTDLAGGVTDVRRGYLAKEWREATASDAMVQLAHPLAPEWAEDCLLTAAADAGAEATRRLALRGVQRERYDLVVALNDETETLDLGQVVHVTHDRFGLSAGAYLRIIGVERDGRELRLTIWK